MKYPTGSELLAAVERFAPGNEQSPRYRAERQLKARERLRDEVFRGPPELWFEWFYRRSRKLDSGLREAGFERLVSALPAPMFAGAVGLDALDPSLYHALVADAVTRQLPGAIGVRELRYENPFFKRLFGKGTAEQTISTTAQVIETVCTLGSTRKMAKADAEVAQDTVDHRIEDSELDVQLKRIKVAREQEALIADRIANVREAQALDRPQRALIDVAMRAGRLDVADALRELDAGDAAALGELGLQHVELEERHEHDDSST
jgi:hypothetical protein